MILPICLILDDYHRLFKLQIQVSLFYLFIIFIFQLCLILFIQMSAHFKKQIQLQYFFDNHIFMSKQRKSSEDSTLKQQCLTSRIKNGKRRAKLEPQLQFSFQKVQSDLLIIQVWDIQFNTTFICQLEAAPTVRFNYVEQQLKDKDYKIMQRSNSILQLQLGGLFLIFENKLQITLDDLKLELKNEKQKNNDLEKRVRELEQRCKNIEWKQLDMNDNYQYRFTLNDGYLYYATNMQTNRFGYIDTSNRNYYIAANNKRSSNSGHTTVKIQYKQK